MLIFKRINELKAHLKALKRGGKTIGFVPTMGALHAGHLSLIKESRKQTNITVCSIFVNPTQFNDRKDFLKYPITIEADTEKLERAKCDVLFLPNVEEIYPNGTAPKNAPGYGFITTTLEGEHRPGHFNGVIQVMTRLLKIVEPDKLFMGRKDYQQQLIIGQLIKKKKLKTKLVTVDTMREKDGLAMSSRNVRLDRTARKLSVEISKTLKAVKAAIRHPKSNIPQIQKWGLAKLSDFKGIEPEYFEIRNAATLKPPKSKTVKLVALTAVKIGGVRLIDNMVLN